jgi:dolichyl-phosphate-mannose--protein O-mannosyl transferase
MIFAGMAGALALQTKFVGLIVILFPCLVLTDPETRCTLHSIIRFLLSRYAVFMLTLLIFYLIPWFFHFHILTKAGPGDAFFHPTGGFLRDVWELHRVMYRANATIATAHPDSSPWWSWPFMMRPPFYWTHGVAFQYLMGNPVVWWGSALAIVALAAQVTLGRFTWLRRFRIGHSFPSFVFYFCALLPFAPLKRPLFLYHYLTAEWFGVLAACLFLDANGFSNAHHLFTSQPRRYWCLLIAILLAFVLVAPLTYGFEIPRWYLRLLYWRPEFLHG